MVLHHRTFFINGANVYSNVGFFSTTFSGSQEIAFVLVPQNTGKIYIVFFASPAAGGSVVSQRSLFQSYSQGHNIV